MSEKKDDEMDGHDIISALAKYLSVSPYDLEQALEKLVKESDGH